MLCAVVTCEGTVQSVVGVVVSEPTLFLHSFRLDVAVEVATPQFFELQLLKGVFYDGVHGFGYQTLTPEWGSNPVADLALIVGDRHIAVGSPCDSDATYGFVGAAKGHGKYAFKGKNSENDIAALIYVAVGRPTGRRAYQRIAGIFVKSPGVGFAPRAKEKSGSGQHHNYTDEGRRVLRISSRRSPSARTCRGQAKLSRINPSPPWPKMLPGLIMIRPRSRRISAISEEGRRVARQSIHARYVASRGVTGKSGMS